MRNFSKKERKKSEKHKAFCSMTVTNIKFRCSSLGLLMTEPRSSKEVLSETTKSYLTEVYVAHKYGRMKDVQNRYTIKGLKVEEDSITLLSRVTKVFFKKNTERISNRYISGVPDLFEGKVIRKAEIIYDVKSSWDIFTFFKETTENLNKKYYWQLQGYMALTGAKTSTLAYCLTDTPDVLINDEKRRLFFKMGLIDETPEFEEACREIERLSVYDDVPLSERVRLIRIDRNEEDIQRLYVRVRQCRQYIRETFIKRKPKQHHFIELPKSALLWA